MRRAVGWDGGPVRADNQSAGGAGPKACMRRYRSLRPSLGRNSGGLAGLPEGAS